MATVDDISERELRDAFNRSGLWRRGWTYAKAIDTPCIITSLCATVRAWHREQQKHGKPAPIQRVLI